MSIDHRAGGIPIFLKDVFHFTYETSPFPSRLDNPSLYDPYRDFFKEKAPTLEFEWRMGGEPFLTSGGILDHYYTVGFEDIVSKQFQPDRLIVDYGRRRNCTKTSCLLKTIVIPLGITVICGIIYYYS